MSRSKTGSFLHKIALQHKSANAQVLEKSPGFFVMIAGRVASSPEFQDHVIEELKKQNRPLNSLKSAEYNKLLTAFLQESARALQ